MYEISQTVPLNAAEHPAAPFRDNREMRQDFFFSFFCHVVKGLPLDVSIAQFYVQRERRFQGRGVLNLRGVAFYFANESNASLEKNNSRCNQYLKHTNKQNQKQKTI